MAYASRVLSLVEQQFMLCEIEILSLAWALEHWDYLVGISPIILGTIHTPTKHVIPGMIKDSGVYSPRIAKWTLALLNRQVTTEPIAKIPDASYALIIEKMNHECLIPAEQQKLMEYLFKGGSKFSEQMLTDFDFIWFVDGSYYLEGTPNTRFAAVNMGLRGEIMRLVKGKCLPHSPQAAKVVAVIVALENTPENKTRLICSDLD